MPQPLRGKYRAFCPHHVNPAAPQQLSAGLTHLSKMRAAGITHLHLLPSYDYGSVPEREEEQARIQVSHLQQTLWQGAATRVYH